MSDCIARKPPAAHCLKPWVQVRVIMVGAKANKTSGQAPIVRVQLKHTGISYLFDRDLKKWVPRMLCDGYLANSPLK